MMGRHIARLEMHLGRAMIVTGDEAEQDFREESSFLRAQPPHDAEVDRCQPSLGVNEQIAGMHVGMKKTVAKSMAQEALDHDAAEFCEIQFPRQERLAV